jgi:Ca-activated chloride channel family protein
LPAAVADLIVLGVGDTRSGTYIDGHQSRQDVATLRQLAARLRGAYHNVNEKHLPSTQLTELARSVPMRDPSQKGSREFALAAVAGGSGLLALLPLALALAGSPWHRRRRTET